MAAAAAVSGRYVLACDWGNVLAGISYKATNEAFAALDIPVALGSGKQDPIMNEMERGEKTAADFYNRIRELRRNKLIEEGKPLGTEPSDDQIQAAFNAIFTTKPGDVNMGFFYERFVYLQDLKARMAAADVDFELIALSNTNAIHLEAINALAAQQGLSEFFGLGQDVKPGIFYRAFPSHELRKRKGEASDDGDDVCARVFAALHYKPERFALIDDSESYCRAVTTSGAGTGLQITTFDLRAFVDRIEDWLPESVRVPEAARDEYVRTMQAETESVFSASKASGYQVTGFSGDVSAGGAHMPRITTAETLPDARGGLHSTTPPPTPFARSFAAGLVTPDGRDAASTGAAAGGAGGKR